MGDEEVALEVVARAIICAAGMPDVFEVTMALGLRTGSSRAEGVALDVQPLDHHLDDEVYLAELLPVVHGVATVTAAPTSR